MAGRLCEPECPICVDSFKTPKLITCGHSFCLQCLKQFIGNRKIHFSCPVCVRKIKIPDGGAETFPTVFALQTSTLQNKSSTDKSSSSNDSEMKPVNELKPVESKLKPVYSELKPVDSEPKCPNHSKRPMDYFCRTCNLGLCAKCMYSGHRDHKSYDLDSDETKTSVLGELSNVEQVARNKIDDLEKYQLTLQDSCKKLKDICEKSCGDITSKTDKIIAQSAKTKKKIRADFKKNDEKLKKIIASNTKHIESLNSFLQLEEPSSTEGSNSHILQSLTKVNDFREICKSIKMEEPDVTYIEVKKSDMISDENIVRVLKPLTLKITGLGDSQCFKFNSNIIKDDGRWYYSEVTLTDHDVGWSCRVARSRNGYLHFGVSALKVDNPNLEYIHVKYRASVVNSDDIHKSVLVDEVSGFTPVDQYFPVLNIEWHRLVNSRVGFVNTDGKFKMKWEITKLYEIQKKQIT